MFLGHIFAVYLEPSLSSWPPGWSTHTYICTHVHTYVYDDDGDVADDGDDDDDSNNDVHNDDDDGGGDDDGDGDEWL